MTFSIFSLTTGNALEWHATEDGALEAAARILESEPEALDSFAVVAFEGRKLIDSLDGERLRERVQPFLTGQHAAHV